MDRKRPVLEKKPQDLNTDKVNGGKNFRKSNLAYYGNLRRRCVKQRLNMSEEIKQELDIWVREYMMGGMATRKDKQEALNKDSLEDAEERMKSFEKKYDYMACEDCPFMEAV
jgi:ribosome recycling factor